MNTAEATILMARQSSAPRAVAIRQECSLTRSFFFAKVQGSFSLFVFFEIRRKHIGAGWRNGRAVM